MTNILGNRKKGRFNPDLGHQVNAEHERAKARGELDKKLRRTEPEEISQEELRYVDQLDLRYVDQFLHPLFDAFMKEVKQLDGRHDGEKYPLREVDKYLTKVSFKRITAKQIELFSQELKLRGFYDEIMYKDYTASFLSEMMRQSEDSNFTLDFRELNEEFFYIGDNLTGKNIHILGDVGEFLCDCANDVTILVDGNIGGSAGWKSHSCTINFKGDEIGMGIGAGSNDLDLVILGNYNLKDIVDKVAKGENEPSGLSIKDKNFKVVYTTPVK